MLQWVNIYRIQTDFSPTVNIIRDQWLHVCGVQFQKLLVLSVPLLVIYQHIFSAQTVRHWSVFCAASAVIGL